MSLLGWVGTLAACCTTFAFVPQIVKIRRQGGDDLSYAMLSFYLTGILLWLAYGLLLHAAAVIWANAATAFLVGVAIVLKATHPSRAARKRAALQAVTEAAVAEAAEIAAASDTAPSSKFAAPRASSSQEVSLSAAAQPVLTAPAVIASSSVPLTDLARES